MNYREAKRIRAGDRVQIWEGTPNACMGTAIKIGPNAIKFIWDDGDVSVIHLRDMSNVNRCGTKAKVRPQCAARLT